MEHGEVIVEETLDPQDWTEISELGHQMLDDMMDYLQSVKERKVWEPVPESVLLDLRTQAPQQPTGLGRVYEDFKKLIMPYPLGNIHPRFWGWVIGTGSPDGMLSEMLAAGLNSNVWGANQVACDVEEVVLNWLKEALGYPIESSGLLVSGCSMANFIALTVARDSILKGDARKNGLYDLGGKPMIYVSEEGHSSIIKAAEMLGIGTNGVKKISTNNDFSINLQKLEEEIDLDIADGKVPVCIVGCAGTVNSGSFDDLSALSVIAKRHKVWFHVDGAFGALAKLSPAASSLVTGMENADSIAFDLHKWLYMPYNVGCILVKDREKHKNSFSVTPDYLKQEVEGLAKTRFSPNEFGPELSRDFKALKVWFLLQVHGFEKYGRLIQQNIDQTHYLAELVENEPNLELMTPVTLNIACFRFVHQDLDIDEINKLNVEILNALQTTGVAAPSGTKLRGLQCIRVANTNHRTKRKDFRHLISSVVEFGNQLTS